MATFIFWVLVLLGLYWVAAHWYDDYQARKVQRRRDQFRRRQ